MIARSPGARLKAAAGYARQDKMIADIGTDHAYLSVYLIGSGISRGAVATDINRGPLERAAANVAAAGLADRITLRLCDGLAGVEAFCPQDIFILGMGGELIARILGESEMIKNEDIRLILQPMTRQAAVREFLLCGGFCIDDEVLVEEDGRICLYVRTMTAFAAPLQPLPCLLVRECLAAAATCAADTESA